MIETKERRIAVETSERECEPEEKNVSILRFPSALRLLFPSENPKGTEEKKRKIVCHVLPGAGVKTWRSIEE